MLNNFLGFPKEFTIVCMTFSFNLKVLENNLSNIKKFATNFRTTELKNSKNSNKQGLLEPYNFINHLILKTHINLLPIKLLGSLLRPLLCKYKFQTT